MNTKGDGKHGRKASGMLSIGGALYLLVRNTENAQLGWSEDHGAKWTWAEWKFTESFRFAVSYNAGLKRYLWCQIGPAKTRVSPAASPSTMRLSHGPLDSSIPYRCLGRRPRRIQLASDQVDERRRNLRAPCPLGRRSFLRPPRHALAQEAVARSFRAPKVFLVHKLQ